MPLVTFALTVLVDLTVAIEVGMVLAAFLFMRRMAEISGVQALTTAVEDDGDELPDPDATGTYRVPRGVEVYEIDGPFFFGAAAAFKDTLARIARKPRVLVIRMRRVPVMDATGLHALADVVRRSRKDGTRVLLCDVQPQPLQTLRRSVLLDEIGESNVVATLGEALERAG